MTTKTKEKETKPKPKAKTILLSPSLWQTWTKCAASLLADKSPFKLESDDYADAGTNLHAAISDSLDGKPFTVDEDDAPLVRFAVETVKNISDKYITEYQMTKTIKDVLIQGTADCIIENGDTVIILDHKTGWKEVDAEGNQQLKIYAHLYALKRPTIKKWKGVIINARFNSTSYAEGDEIDNKFLATLADDTKARIKAKQTRTGNHCAYCPRLTTCKTLRADVTKWLAPGAIDSITRKPAELADALKLAKPAEKLFDTIKKEAQLYIDLGGIIPGVSIEYTSGTRTWPRDMTVTAVAEAIGLKVKDMTDEKTISPAEATRLGADKEAINRIAIRPPRKGFKFS